MFARRQDKTPHIEQAEKDEHKRIITKRNIVIGLAIAAGICAICLVSIDVVIPSVKYNEAREMYRTGQYQDAVAAFQSLGDYKDSATQVLNAKYANALDLVSRKKYVDAIAIFYSLHDYKDSAAQVLNAKYVNALDLVSQKKYVDAIAILSGSVRVFSAAPSSSATL